MSETFEVGEGFAGDGANAAHINTVLGKNLVQWAGHLSRLWVHQRWDTSRF